MKQLPLPGHASRVVASRVLVLAPHADDEIVGCGGLLAQLLAAGAAVTVFYLTDSSGGTEAIDDRPAYRSRRRREAESVAARLGFAPKFFDAPDGSLHSELDRLVPTLCTILGELEPDLILAPAPTEATEDHRAAFAALSRALGQTPELAATRILAYEVNRPLQPDLLVDVSGELEVLRQAMADYSSQEERHPYLAAALGLRAYRALSLGPAVVGAEGYRELTPLDLRTHSPARLLLELGSAPRIELVDEVPSMSVVVRTCNRPTLLHEALASLSRQSWRRSEVVVVNDGGAAPQLPSDFPVALRLLDLPQNRGRSGAANAGITAATGDLVCFLDDDDLADPEHLETLARASRAAGVEVAYVDAAVVTYTLAAEGWQEVERRVPYSRDFDPDLLLVDNYIPFNTIAVPRRLLAEVGPLDESLPFFEDWELLIRLSRRVRFHHLAKVTCEYRHFSGGSQIFGSSPRERADFLRVKGEVIDRHRGLLDAERLAGVIDRLRAEAVSAHEEARRWQIDGPRALDRAARAEAGLAGLEERWRELEGSWQALQREVARLQAREATLAAELQQRDQQLAAQRLELERLLGSEAALYQEVARQEQLRHAMESTRAWRIHRWLEARRGR
jgi:LmbE family N-acetylglucosaminyl deacetylase